MRPLGFTKKWSKLSRDEFTTFRFMRKDSDKGRDWKVGETVQIVYHPRSKDREVLGTARIVRKEAYMLRPTIGYLYPTEADAEADGFESLEAMLEWFHDTHGERIFNEPINKLTLERTQWVASNEVEMTVGKDGNSPNHFKLEIKEGKPELTLERV